MAREHGNCFVEDIVDAREALGETLVAEPSREFVAQCTVAREYCGRCDFEAERRKGGVHFRRNVASGGREQNGARAAAPVVIVDQGRRRRAVHAVMGVRRRMKYGGMVLHQFVE